MALFNDYNFSQFNQGMVWVILHNMDTYPYHDIDGRFSYECVIYMLVK